MGFGAARLLEYGIDVDATLGENCGEGGDDAGAVFHQKAQIVFGGEVGRDSGRFFGGLSGVTHAGLLGASDG